MTAAARGVRPDDVLPGGARAGVVTRDADVRRAYARDASGLELVPEGVARPADEAEVAALLRDAAAAGTPVTPAGAQTSTTGASITDRGVLLSLRGMARVLDVDPVARTARVEPGVLVAALKAEVAPLGLLFAPDPTSEHECTVGGAVACNASGARTLRYGATRAHVRALRVATLHEGVLELRRPALEKNTVGYAMAHDPVDWFVGSEGTLGVVTAAEVALVRRPARVIGLAVPFAAERPALAFIAAARGEGRAQALEYFDALALGVVREAAADPRWGGDGAAALAYAEEAFDEDDDGAVAAALDAWLALAERHGAAADDIRVYDGEVALREARRLRHAVPARMNERGDARRAHGGRKVSTDWAVPYERLADALDFARAAADRHGVAQAVTYGHAGNGHPHQNFIAHDAGELARVERVVEETLRHVLALGGTVAAEHGLGKLKRKWLGVQLPPLQVEAMRALKRTLDPRGLLAPGNVL